LEQGDKKNAGEMKQLGNGGEGENNHQKRWREAEDRLVRKKESTSAMQKKKNGNGP